MIKNARHKVHGLSPVDARAKFLEKSVSDVIWNIKYWATDVSFYSKFHPIQGKAQESLVVESNRILEKVISKYCDDKEDRHDVLKQTFFFKEKTLY